MPYQFTRISGMYTSVSSFMDPAATRSTESRSALDTAPWWRVLTPSLLVGFCVLIITIIFILGVGLVNLRQVRATGGDVARTYSVKVATQSLLTAILDAETGERGYIITNDPKFLEPYSGAREAVSDALARVRTLTVGVTDQQTDVQRLSDAVRQKLAELADAIGKRRETGFDAAQAQVAMNLDKRTMDEIRTIVARMEAREDAQLALRTEQAAQSYRTAVLTRLVTTAVAVLAVVALFVGTVRYGAMQLRATRAAEEQQQQLVGALRQKDDFVALVSHELRTPINTILGWAQMLGDHAVDGERRQHAIAAIERGADSLRQLIDDLMDTTQMVSGRLRLTIAPLDVAEVLRDAIETVRLSAEKKSVAIRERIPSDLPAIHGDAGRLKQVVLNLLTNAIKFTPTGGTVAVEALSTGAGLRVEIRDTGEGIDPAFLPYVFERYRQAPSAHALRGIGLGLAIVKHLVELHGGSVTAHSAGLGQGTTFVVELPSEKANVAARAS
jgi:signal transduction histidine kinase